MFYPFNYNHFYQFTYQIFEYYPIFMTTKDVLSFLTTPSAHPDQKASQNCLSCISHWQLLYSISHCLT